MLCPVRWSYFRSCLPFYQVVLPPGLLCLVPCSSFCLVSGLVSQSPSLFFSLGYCIRLPGLDSGLISRDVIFDSLVLTLSCLRSCLLISQLALQPGMLYLAPWSCLRSCFPGCCIRFRIRFPGLIFILFPVLICNLPACSLAWDAVSGSLVSSPVFSPGMLYPTPCSYFPISQFVLQPGMLQFPNLFFSLGCCIRLPGLVSCPVSRDAVSDSLVLSLSCLRFYFPIW